MYGVRDLVVDIIIARAVAPLLNLVAAVELWLYDVGSTGLQLCAYNTSVRC